MLVVYCTGCSLGPLWRFGCVILVPERNERSSSMPARNDHTSSASYEKERTRDVTLKLRSILDELPAFARQFFVASQDTMTPLTRLNYARDIRIFFEFLTREIPAFASKSMREITLDDLRHLTVDDLYGFLDYLSLYSNESDVFQENHERGKARKVAALRSFFKHYFRKGQLDKNVTELLDTPKLHEQPITRLSPDEAATLLDIVESGEGLTPQQLRYHKRNVKRDLAIFTLFLTTGIRVSELVGMNVGDVDLRNNSFVVTRKGGARVVLYFDEEARNALEDYIEERAAQGTGELSAPLFQSMQGKRLTVRAVENLVKKYARLAAPLKRISPHKLRSTFGTMLYEETGDIYLVADVLGHKDVNTTRRHYAAQSEENRRTAARAVKLRK